MFDLDCLASRYALGFLLFYMTTACCALVLSALPWWSILALFLTVTLLSAKRVSRELPGSVQRITRCRVGASYWRLERAVGFQVFAPPRIIFFSECLIVLQFEELLEASSRDMPNQVTMTFLPDSLPLAQSRRLRRHLLFDNDSVRARG